MSAMLSPEVYFLCSENSTENPWKGLAWRSEMNPSMMNLARRSSLATWRMTSGFRYFSAGPAKGDAPVSISSEDVGKPDHQPRKECRRVHVGIGQDALDVT